MRGTGGPLLLLLAAPAFAGFGDTGYSARAAAMGSAFTAVSDDVSGMVFNPANSGQVREIQSQLSYLRQRHLPGGVIDQDFLALGAVFPVQQELIRGGVGLLWSYEKRPGVSTGRMAGLNYGTRGLFEFEEGGLELGSNLKFMSQSGAGLKPAIDLGVLGRLRERTQWGVSVINANRPSLGMGDRAPAAIRAGVSEQVRGFTLALDVAKREPSSGLRGVVTIGSGIERWWPTERKGSFAARLGLLMSDPTRTFNWGLGWRIMGGQVDYAMTVPMRGALVTGHALTFLLRFGVSDPEREYERMLTQEVRYRKDLTQALEAGEVKQWKLAEELRTLRDEMEDLKERLADKTASESQAREKLRALERRRKEAAERLEALSSDRAKTRSALLKEDWLAYQRLKLSGAPDSVLLEHVRRLLREHKDAGGDLSEANQELLRLLRAQPAP